MKLVARGSKNKPFVNYRNRNKGSARNNTKRGNYHFCKSLGHWARECEKKQAYLDNKKQGQSMLSEQSNATQNAELFNVKNTLCAIDDKNIWFPDSGATDHMS